MKGRLHLRAEYGQIRAHIPFDLNVLADLVLTWRAAMSAKSTLTELLDAEGALLEYLRLELDAEAVKWLLYELGGLTPAWVRTLSPHDAEALRDAAEDYLAEGPDDGSDDLWHRRHEVI